MSSTWLVDAENPLLTEPVLARMEDASRPDRLAWNTFRTLALWEPDVWIPRLLGVACGEGSPLVAVEWSGTSVLPWAAGLALDGVTDVVLDGPEALVVAAATLSPGLSPQPSGLLAEVIEAAGDARQAGFVAVVAPGSDRPASSESSDRPASAERSDGVDVTGDGFTGWLTWAELGTLALDLAEEGDELRGEQVSRLVDDLQRQFPGIEL
ncbi:MAG TPA: hypothetical protein VG455_00030 [Acidimicrobiales bacterium]|nr:hypothetical protein [Acidimicrobiales bacterium]